MATNNAINLSQQGTAYYNGTGTFSGVDGVTAGYIYTSNGTSVAPSFQPASGFNPSTMISLYDDFIYFNNTGLNSQMPWFVTGASFSPSSSGTVAGNPGVISFGGGASTSMVASAQASSPIPTMKLGGGVITVNWIVKVAILSTASPRYNFQCGLGDPTAAVTEPANGVYFNYSDNLNSGNWVGKTSAASSRSSANSSVAVINSAFVNLGIVINAAATSVAFYVNGTQIANSPLAANIPTASIQPFAQIVSSVGVLTTASVLIDAFYMTQTFTTPR